MVVERYLQGKNYYENLYDRFTVDECRRLDNKLKKIELKKKKSKKYQVEILTFKVLLYTAQGERYANRDRIIGEWMEEDKKKDNFLANTETPKIYCLYCNEKMEVAIKSLDSSIDGKNNKILFFYECKECNKRRAFYNTGEEYRPKEISSKLKLEDIKIPIRKIDKDFEKDRLRFCLDNKEGGDYISTKIKLEQFI